MGAAQSSNIASATSQITNYIQDSSEVSQSQVQNIANSITLKNCEIIATGNVDISSLALTIAKNKQLNKALNNNSINNQIQQKMLQTAASTVGSMGIGYADANNSANMYANASNTVVNSTRNISSQVADINQNFTCEGSYIKGKNISISLNSNSQDVSNQILKSQDVNDVITEVSQTAEQKATAKVQGLAGLIVALAVLIGSLGYTVAKPLSSGGMKIVLVIIILLILGGLFSFMYIKKTPPFFTDNNVCNPRSNLGGNCSSDCIKQTNQTISIDSSPLRYVLALPGGQEGSGTTSNLLGTAIAGVVNSVNSGKPVNNQGYNIDVKTLLESKVATLISNISKSCPEAIPTEKLPPLMVNPYGNDDKNTGYIIPPQYMYGTGDGSCTPNSIQVKGGQVPTSFDNCPTTISANTSILKPTSISDAPDQYIANSNDEEWETYCTDSTIPIEELQKRQMLARFVLGTLSAPNMDMTVYADPNEIISYLSDDSINTIYSIASKDPNNSYRFHPSGSSFSMLDSNSDGGKVEGIFGICNDRTYKFHQFALKAGAPLMSVFTVGVLSYIMLRKGSPKGIEKAIEGKK